MIPNEFLQTLLARVDIVPIIDRAVPLKKAGANYSACCPFHKEKTPSFSVSPSKQFYHCFGCGAHGTAISFLMEYQGKSFPDAVEELAQGVGMEVPRNAQAREQAQAAGGLYEVLLTATQYFKTKLKQNPPAIEYFKSRGVTGEVARTFHLGYAPDKWQGLEEAFEDYKDAALEQAGLVIVGDGDKRYDRFRGRVMFPILNQQGRVIAFGGRVLGEGEPKYLNSPETPVFSKGRELYGLYQAQKAIRDEERVLVVEGYMDVIALHQFGVQYAVATLGTATTEQHIERLFRLADEVVFSFDGDKAGVRAAWRALENALPALQDGKAVKFLFLPAEHDPDSYIREHGTEAFTQRIREAEPLSKYWLRTLQAQHAEDSPEARSALLAQAKTYLDKVGAPLMRDVLIREVAQAARVDPDTFAKSMAAQGQKRNDPPDSGDTYAPAPPRESSDSPRYSESISNHRYDRADDRGYGNQDGSGDFNNSPRRPGRFQKKGNVRPPPRVTPPSVYERLLRLGLESPQLLLSLEDKDIESAHPDALLLQSAVRIAKTAPQVIHRAVELIALAQDDALKNALEEKLRASMGGVPLAGKPLEDEWRALVERARAEAKAPGANKLYMQANNRPPGS